MFSLIDAFYKCSALANKFSSFPLTVKKKIPLKISPLCSPQRVKAPNDLPPELRSGALFKDTLWIPSAFTVSSILERHLHIFTIKGRKCSCHSVPVSQMNSGTSGLAPASWLHCPRRVSCLLQLDEVERNGWHLHWLCWSGFEFGTFTADKWEL